MKMLRHRHSGNRSKSTLSSLALGGPNSRDILETPGSYKASLPDNTEEEVAEDSGANQVVRGW